MPERQRASGADVLIIGRTLRETLAPPVPASHGAAAGAPDLYASWREAGRVVAVRVNPLDQDGMDDLAAVMRGRARYRGLPKVAEPRHVALLDEAVSRFERDYGIAEGSTALLPNIEFAARAGANGRDRRRRERRTACLLASEDLAADLGAEREPDGIELAYCRQRFIVECRAADVVAVDCPYTWSDAPGVERDTRWARRLGYIAKSLVDPAHAAMRQRRADARRQRDAPRPRHRGRVRIGAGARGDARAEHEGSLLEVPTYSNAKRLLARGEALRRLD